MSDTVTASELATEVEQVVSDVTGKASSDTLNKDLSEGASVLDMATGVIESRTGLDVTGILTAVSYFVVGTHQVMVLVRKARAKSSAATSSDTGASS